MKLVLVVILIIASFLACTEKKSINNKSNKIDMSAVEKKLIEKYGESNSIRIKAGLAQVAALWQDKDGSQEEFDKFALDNFIADSAKLDELFITIDNNMEVINGHFNKISLDLKRKLHIDKGEISGIDEMFGAYEPSSHLSSDFYNNKIAFVVALNFPYYSAKEKDELGMKWSAKQWAYSRIGDMFVSRVPAELNQAVSKAQSDADNYISNYYIHMNSLVNNKKEKLFPEGLKLISHWNLRDELKSQYAKQDGLQRQELIYSVMTNIIQQTIPNEVINNPEYLWNPISNKVTKDGKEFKYSPEPNTRYKHFLANFKAVKAIDEFSPQMPTYIQRKFDGEMEMTMKEVEDLFISFVSDPTVKEVAKLIEKRLGRKLKPFDIWYDGFKARSNINEDELSAMTKKLYPSENSFKKELPIILTKLGFDNERANYLASQVEVDPSRGAGHAWGAQMRGEKARLRTKIKVDGMDYKGYNIAVHEFGHNVEQTISLNEVPYHVINGVPNTAFTEAIAFVFQSRDLMLLGKSSKDEATKHLYALDNFWSTYEIMGVALTDIGIWKWLYDNPNTTEEELKTNAVRIAKEIWNKYYAPIIGEKDSPILAIYSHSIDYPLYLSAYPIGHLIEFQIEQYIDGKNLAIELERMCRQGRLTPQVWMQKAVGSKISTKPTINAAKEALERVRG